MTIFEMQGVLRGKAIPGDMKVNESLAEYLVRKFAEKDAANEQLKQRLNAVVAECADLKTCAIGWAELYADEMGDPHITEDALPKTPNADAALAEQQAIGVERAAKELFGCGYSFELLIRHAAALRKGESQ